MDQMLKKCSDSSLVRVNPLMKSTMVKMYQERHETGDIKFIVGSEQIPAHRSVLAALSPKYKAQFYGAMAEVNTVNVEDVSAAALEEFLQFFYTDEVKLTIDNIEDVLNLAQQSLVDHLVEECMQFLMNMVGLDKLIWCYRLALRYEINSLEEFCTKQISENTTAVFLSSDFLRCERAMLDRILDFESMDCDETVVFVSAIKWARNKCDETRIDGFNQANVRAALGNVLFKVRFCSMAAEQFARIGKLYPGILTAQESVEAYEAILLKVYGLASNTFGEANCKARKLLKSSSLDCAVSTGPPIKTAFESGDCIRFSCDKAIFLHGFVICQVFAGVIDVEIDVADVDQSVNHTTSISDTETIVTFEHPILINHRESCSIDFTPKSLIDQLAGDCYGYNIANTKQHGVTFTFPSRFLTAINLITRLQFSVGESL